MRAFSEATFLNPDLMDKIDGVLNGQKTSDIKWMRYQLFDRSFDKQQSVLLTKQPTSILVCGRRAGKTEVLATKIVQVAIAGEKGEDVIYIGKTYTSAYEIIWQRIVDLLNEINVPFTALLSEQTITLASGVNIYVRGAHTVPDIDKLRGHKYKLTVIDEIQSIKHLRMLINEILRPAMADFVGAQMFLAGTPPRVKGTYVENIWESTSKYVSKFHWDLTDNPFIPDNENVLTRVREEQNYAVDNPVYQREWLGMMGIYDIDALVFAPSTKNNKNEDELRIWVESQRPEDLFFSAGLDLGWSDSDAFVIILGSRTRPEKWLVYEHKQNKNNISQLVTHIHEGFAYIRNHLVLRNVPGLDLMRIWTDAGGGGKKISMELRDQYRLPCVDAIKTDKTMAIDLLREEVRLGRLKYNLEGLWADETQKIIYERDDNDKITTVIDDSYHPDLLDAVLYSMRPLWKVSTARIVDAPKPQTEEQLNQAQAGWRDVAQTIMTATGPQKVPDFLDDMFREHTDDFE